MLSWLWSDPLPAGTKAPAFSLSDDSGRVVHLAELRGRNVVLVFYPGDDTPGCTKQLCQFRDDWNEAQARGVTVFGVNPQSAQKHVEFRRNSPCLRALCGFTPKISPPRARASLQPSRNWQSCLVHTLVSSPG